MPAITRLACIIHRADHWRRSRTLEKLGIDRPSVGKMTRYVNAGLCSAGLIERHPAELLTGFLLELSRIVYRAITRRNWSGLHDGLCVGFDILRGMALDGIHSRSLRLVLQDIRWASRKVPGPDFGYGGDVALLFARDDTVIRWQTVFPGCAAPDEIPAQLETSRISNFPNAARIRVDVLEGDHLSPEHTAMEYALAVFCHSRNRT